jgi:hypothetical protein
VHVSTKFCAFSRGLPNQQIFCVLDAHRVPSSGVNTSRGLVCEASNASPARILWFGSYRSTATNHPHRLASRNICAAIITLLHDAKNVITKALACINPRRCFISRHRHRCGKLRTARSQYLYRQATHIHPSALRPSIDPPPPNQVPITNLD